MPSSHPVKQYGNQYGNAPLPPDLAPPPPRIPPSTSQGLLQATLAPLSFTEIACCSSLDLSAAWDVRMAPGAAAAIHCTTPRHTVLLHGGLDTHADRDAAAAAPGRAPGSAHLSFHGCDIDPVTAGPASNAPAAAAVEVSLRANGGTAHKRRMLLEIAGEGSVTLQGCTSRIPCDVRPPGMNRGS